MFIIFFFFFSSRRRHTSFSRDWSSDVCSSDLDPAGLQKYAAEIAGSAGGLFLNLAGGIFGFFTAVVLTAYFIIDGESTFRWGVSLFAVDQQERLGATLLRAKARMRNWLIGQTVLMLSLGLSSLVVYYLLGLKYFYLLAMFAGVV